jgi:DNA topoisomerase-3
MTAPSDSPGNDQQPTVAMKKFVVSLAKQKGIKPPRGYTKSAAICRGFLDQHASGKGRAVSVPREEARAEAKPIKRRRKTVNKPKADTTASAKNAQCVEMAAPTTSPPAQRHAMSETPLKIPYGNKEDARKLGARYRTGGWYAPLPVPGTCQ